MEKKNMVLLTVIAVATLLVAVVGATFAYFTATVNDTYSSENDQGQADISSAKIAGTTTFASSDNNAGKFTATDVYPGHAEVATIKVTASGDEGQQSSIRLTYSVTENTFGSSALKAYVFKSSKEINLGNEENALQCAKQIGTGSDSDEGKTTYFETCTGWTDKDNNSLKDGTAEIIGDSNGKNVPTSNSVILAEDTLTISSGGSETVYYYVVIEFQDTKTDQESAQGKKLDGEISITAA